VGNIIYFSDSGMHDTTALNAVSGRKVWKFGHGAFNPVISDGRTIFLTGHSSQYAMRPKGIPAKAVLKPTTAREARQRQRAHRRKVAREKRAAARKKHHHNSKRG
jgi:hypothetical protein